MNGFFCNRSDFVVVEFESISKKFKTQVTWPIFMRMHESDNGTLTNWSTVLNGNREWHYINGKPSGNRFNRFASLMRLAETYSVDFDSQPPNRMRFQFQRKDKTKFNAENWVILEVYYPQPNSIRVQVNGKVIHPITVLDNGSEESLYNNTHICGANTYFFKNQTIQFVINGEKSCRPKLIVTNSIRLTVKFAMPIEEFFANDGKAKFIDKMAALLGIQDYSRIKVVGIYNGSTELGVFVEDEHNLFDENAT